MRFATFFFIFVKKRTGSFKMMDPQKYSFFFLFPSLVVISIGNKFIPNIVRSILSLYSTAELSSYRSNLRKNKTLCLEPNYTRQNLELG